MYMQKREESHPFTNPVFDLVETVGAGQPPDFTEETDLFLAMDNQLNDFKYIFEDIDNSGGISQQIAMEAHKLIDGMDERLPVGYFTKAPSATQLRPALEELHGGIWALIGAAALAVMTMIYKFIKWIRGKKDDSNAPGGAASPAEIKKEVEEIKKEVEGEKEGLKKAADASAKAVEAAKDSEAALHAAAAENKESGQVIPKSFEEAANVLFERSKADTQVRFLRMEDPSHYDIIKEGRWTKLMLGLAPVLNSVEQVVIQRVQSLEHLLETDLNGGDPIKIKQTSDLLDRVKDSVEVKYENFRTLEDLANALTNERGMMTHNHAKQVMSPVVVADRIRHVTMSDAYMRLLDFKAKFVEQLGNLHSLEFRIHQISEKHSGAGNATMPHELAQKFAAAKRTLGHDARRLVAIQGHLEVFLDKVQEVMHGSNNTMEHVFRSLAPYLKNGTESGKGLPESVIDALHTLEDIKKEQGNVPWANR